MRKKKYEQPAYEYEQEAYDQDIYDEQDPYEVDLYAPADDTVAYAQEGYDEEGYVPQEDAQYMPRAGFRVAAGAFDLIGVACCTLLVLLLLAAASGLYTWLRGDLNSVFSIIGQNINEAVVIDTENPQ